jgi:CheY-like chemotaxis protein
MSHEIRTPISGIIGLSEHLSDCGLNEEQLEFSNSIEESAKFLLTLVNDVLDFSKMESGHMDIEQIPFSPYKLISDTLIPLRLQARERGLSLNFRCDLKPDALFLGDPWRLRQILTNLIGNSLKFTQQGHIALSVHEAGKKDNQVTLKFVVKDSGVGISEEAIKLLFKPFNQADGSTARLYGGTGLGLAICRQLVELMGGHIGLESVHAESTTATCMIPFQNYHGPTHDLLISTALPDRAKIQNPEKKANTEKAGDLSPSDGTNVMTLDSFAITNIPGIDNHILLVEDNPINRKVISIALKKLGFVVSAVWNGQEALDFLCKESTKPRPDAILMDCMMPNVDGYEATRRIRNDKAMFDEQVRELPIIALTASAIKGDKEKCWDAGMDDYLTKPAARDELRRTLARWLVTPRIRGLDRSRPLDGSSVV